MVRYLKGGSGAAFTILKNVKGMILLFSNLAHVVNKVTEAQELRQKLDGIRIEFRVSTPKSGSYDDPPHPAKRSSRIGQGVRRTDEGA